MLNSHDFKIRPSESHFYKLINENDKEALGKIFSRSEEITNKLKQQLEYSNYEFGYLNVESILVNKLMKISKNSAELVRSIIVSGDIQAQIEIYHLIFKNTMEAFISNQDNIDCDIQNNDEFVKEQLIPETHNLFRSYQSKASGGLLGNVLAKSGVKMVFIFMQRLWRVGNEIDVQNCVEVLQSAIEEIQEIPVAGFFNISDNTDILPFWSGVTEQTYQFLKNTVLCADSNDVIVPKPIRDSALVLLLEMGLIYGNLSLQLKHVIMMIELSSGSKNYSNLSSPTDNETMKPMITGRILSVLIRIAKFVKSSTDNNCDRSVHLSFNPCLRLLDWMHLDTMKKDEPIDVDICLLNAAVYIMSCLDCLTIENQIAYSTWYKAHLFKNTDNSISTYKYDNFLNTFCSTVDKSSHKLYFIRLSTSLTLMSNDIRESKFEIVEIKPDKLSKELNEKFRIKKIVCSGVNTYILSDCGWLYEINNSSDDVIETFTFKHNAINHQFDCLKSDSMLKLCPKNKIVDVDANIYSSHVLAITEAGQVYSWGTNTSGKLGHGDTKDRKRPTIIDTFSRCHLQVKQVACGEEHNLILTQSGEIYSCGRNHMGQLGHGDVKDRHLPIPITATDLIGVVVKQIAVDGHQSMCLSNDGVIFTWGSTFDNCRRHLTNWSPKIEICVNEYRNEIEQIQVHDSTYTILLKSGSVYTWLKYCSECNKSDDIQPELDTVLKYQVDNVSMISKGDGEFYFLDKSGIIRTKKSVKIADHKFSGFGFIKRNYILAWSLVKEKPKLAQPFILEVSIENLKLLSRLLSSIIANFGTADNENIAEKTESNNWLQYLLKINLNNKFELTEDRLCILVSSLHLLSIQLLKIVEEQLKIPNELLVQLKRDIINCCCGTVSQMHISIKHAAHMCLISGWKILFASQMEKLLGIYYTLQIAESSMSRYNLIVAMCLDTIDLKQFIHTLIELSTNNGPELPNVEGVIETIVKYTFTNIRSQFILPVVSSFKTSPGSFIPSVLKNKELLDYDSINGTNTDNNNSHSIMDKLFSFLGDLLKKIIFLLQESTSTQDNLQSTLKLILSIYGKVLAQQTIETAEYCWSYINKSNVTPKQLISTLNNSGFSYLLLNFIESFRWLLKNYLNTKSILKSDYKLWKTNLKLSNSSNPMFHYDLLFKFSVNLREIIFGFKPLVLLLDKINRLNESLFIVDCEDGSLPGWLYNPLSETFQQIDKIIFRMKDILESNDQLIVIDNRVYDIDRLSIDSRAKFDEYLPNRNSIIITDIVHKSIFRKNLLKLLIDCYCGEFIDDDTQPISYFNSDNEDFTQLYFIERMLLMLMSDVLLFHQSCCSLMKQSIGFKQLQEFSVEKFPLALKQIVLKKRCDQSQTNNDTNTATILSFSHMEEKERDEVEETNDMTGTDIVNINEDSNRKIIKTCINLLMFGSASSIIDKGMSPIMTNILQWLRSDTYKTKNLSKTHSTLLLDNIQDSYLDSLFVLNLIALVKHVNLCEELANHIMRRNYGQPMSNELIIVIQQSILIRTDIIKRHQQTSISYKELCSNINVRCRFLIDEIEILSINGNNTTAGRKKSININDFNNDNSTTNRWKSIAYKAELILKKPKKPIDYWQIIYNFVMKKFSVKTKQNTSSITKFDSSENINEFCAQISQFLLNKEIIDLQKLRTLVLAKKIQFKSLINILKEFKVLLQFTNGLLPGVQVSLLQFFCEKISNNDISKYQNETVSDEEYIYDVLRSANSLSMFNFVSCHTRQSLLQTEYSLVQLSIQVLRDNLLTNEQKIESLKCTNKLNNQSHIVGIGHWPNAKLNLSLCNFLLQSISWSNEIYQSLVVNGVLGLIQTLLNQYFQSEPGLINIWCQENRNYQLVMSDSKNIKNYPAKSDSIEDLNSSAIALPSQLKKGTLVLRGRDWKYGDQDGPNSVGVVKRECINGMVRIQWLNNKKTASYRAGKDNFYDLRLKKSIEDLKNETPAECGVRSLMKDISMLQEKFRVNRLERRYNEEITSSPIKNEIEDFNPLVYSFPLNWNQSSMLLLHSAGQLMQAVSIQQLIANQNNVSKVNGSSDTIFNKIYLLLWTIYRNSILTSIHKNDSIKNMYQEQINLWCNQSLLLTMLTQHNSSWPNSNDWIFLFLKKAEIEIKISSTENILNQILTLKILEKLISRSAVTNTVIERLWNCMQQAIREHYSEDSKSFFNVHSLNASPSKIRIMELSIIFRNMLRCSSINQISTRNFLFNIISQSLEQSDNQIQLLGLFCIFSDIENRIYPGIAMSTTKRENENKDQICLGIVEEITMIENDKFVVTTVVPSASSDSFDSIADSHRDFDIHDLTSDLQIDSSKILFPFEIISSLTETESEIMSKFLLMLISNLYYSNENSLSKTSSLQNVFKIMQLSTLMEFCEHSLTELWYPIFQSNSDVFKCALDIASRACSIKPSISIHELKKALTQLSTNIYSAADETEPNSSNVKLTDFDSDENSLAKPEKKKKSSALSHIRKSKHRHKESRRDPLNINMDLQFRIMEMGFTKRQIQAAVKELARNGNLYLTSNPELIITTILNFQQDDYSFLPIEDVDIEADDDNEEYDDSTGRNMTDDNSSCSTVCDHLQYVMPMLQIHSPNASDNDEKNYDLLGNDDNETNEDEAFNADISTDDDVSEDEDNLVISDAEKENFNDLNNVFNVVCVKNFDEISVGDRGVLNSDGDQVDGYCDVFWFKSKKIISTEKTDIHIFTNPTSSIIIGDEVKFSESGIRFHMVSAMTALSNGIVRQIIRQNDDDEDLKIIVDFPNCLGKVCSISDLKLVAKDQHKCQCQACLKSPLSMPMYKCKVCHNLYLCSSCYSKFQKTHNHKFLNISIGKEINKPKLSTGNSFGDSGKVQTLFVTASVTKPELKLFLSFTNFSLTPQTMSRNIEYTSNNNHCLIKIAEGYRVHKIFMLISLSEFLLLPSQVIVKKGVKSKKLSTVYRANIQSLKEDQLIINSSKYYSSGLKLMWLKIYQDKIKNQSNERVFSLDLFDDSSSLRTVFNAVKSFHFQLIENRVDRMTTVMSNELLLKTIFSISDKNWSADEIDTICNDTIYNWRQARINKLQFQINSNMDDSTETLNDNGNQNYQGDKKFKSRLTSKIYVWGLNDKDQLGCEATSKVKLPILNDALSELDCVSISGGSKSLFCVTRNGKVYVAGDSSNGRLGIGSITDIPADVIIGPKKLEALDKYFIVKVAVHSGGRHAIALTKNGEIFSWGEGDDGKLGHNSRLRLDYPRKIKYFKGKRVVDVACGSNHSAAVIFGGHLYTWGLGDYGRLGHGDTSTRLLPELVKSLRDYKVVQVACGSRDAQTLALTSDFTVWSWGDGDFGKLGRGGSTGCLVPQKIECMSQSNVIQIECGAQSSFALTENGQVWTWGKGDYYRLGHGTDKHIREPMQIEDLKKIKIVHLAVGALHCLAVTDRGLVYSWGDNDHGQQGNGTVTYNMRPTLVSALADIKIAHVACGSSHSVARTASDLDLFLPSQTLNRWPHVKEMSYSLAAIDFSPLLFQFNPDPLGAGDVFDIDQKIYQKRSRTDESTQDKNENEVKTRNDYCLPVVISQLRGHKTQVSVIYSLFRNLQVFVSRKLISHLMAHTISQSTEISQLPCNALSIAQNQKLSYMESFLLAFDYLKLHNAFPIQSVAYLQNFWKNTDFNHSNDLRQIAILLLIDEIEKFGDSNSSKNNGIHHYCDNKDFVNMIKRTRALSIVRESSHPYNENAKLSGKVIIPDAPRLVIEFDRQCSTERNKDILILMDHNNAVVAERSGQRWEDWGSKVIINGNELHWSFKSDGSITAWGWRFEVKPLWKQCKDNTENFDTVEIVDNNELLILFSPNIPLIKGLLDKIELQFEDTSLALQLIKSLSQMGFSKWDIDCESRIWAIRQILAIICNLNLGVFAQFMKAVDSFSIIHERFDSKTLAQSDDTPDEVINFDIEADETSSDEEQIDRSSQLINDIDTICGFLLCLQKVILKQFKFEEPEVKSSKQLFYSRFLKSLIELSCCIRLDSLSPVSTADEWAWFRNYCLTYRTTESLITNSSLPYRFINEFKSRFLKEPTVKDPLIREINAITAVSEYADPREFSYHHDLQIVGWLKSRPEAWKKCWPIDSASGLEVWSWGHNHRGQLGGVEGSKIKVPVLCEHLSALRPRQIIGGEQSLFIVSIDGRVYATGFGNNGRLGIGSSESVQTPILVSGLEEKIVVKVAVNSGGKHCLALCNNGLVYAWGDAEDNKLGLDIRIQPGEDVLTPTLVKSLVKAEIIDIAAGGSHSAAISKSGELYTWGKGRYGRLGHGNGDDQPFPKIVEALRGYHVIGVACGSGDAQTLCITKNEDSRDDLVPNTSVWSWGDGDYGKLGRGGFDICKLPMKIETLEGAGVIKVDCGSQFSLALTANGEIYTWGKGDYFRLGHGSDNHVRKPERVAQLNRKKIIDVACGSLHCICCTEDGEVYSWGDNDEGQLGDGTTTTNSRPRIIESLTGKGINRVACGSAHTLAWTTVSGSKSHETESPEQRLSLSTRPTSCRLLENKSAASLINRFLLLHHWTELFCSNLHFMDLNRQSMMDKVRQILFPNSKESLFRLMIQTTMYGSKKHGPEIKVNRLHASAGTPAGVSILHRPGWWEAENHSDEGRRDNVDLCTVRTKIPLEKTVFGQLGSKLIEEADCISKNGSIFVPPPEFFLLPNRVWKVKLIGESVDDCGGGYSESITEICDELQNGHLPFLISSPDKDCFVLSPNSDKTSIKWFIFLGSLLGIAIRTNQPLSLTISDLIWKILSGQSLSKNDLQLFDKDLLSSLMSLKTMEDMELENLQISYSVTTIDGQEVNLKVDSSGASFVTAENRDNYIDEVINYKIHEFDKTCLFIRRGMSLVIPLPLLNLFSSRELECLVCGNDSIPISFLKSITLYRGVKSDDLIIIWFWEIMEEMTNEVRSLFLRFVWGRTRLPRYVSDLRGKEFVIQVLSKYSPADDYLPEAYTCFFLLKLPNYSSKAILQEKLLYAIHFCKSIDIDDYARIALNPDSLPCTESVPNLPRREITCSQSSSSGSASPRIYISNSSSSSSSSSQDDDSDDSTARAPNALIDSSPSLSDRYSIQRNNQYLVDDYMELINGVFDAPRFIDMSLDTEINDDDSSDDDHPFSTMTSLFRGLRDD